MVTMGNAQHKAGCCSSDARSGGFTCLPNWLFGEATAQELVVLLALQHHAPNIHPSLAALARESGLGKSTVCRTLAALKARGWLRTERRFTTEGRNCPTAYHLMIQRGKPDPSAVVPERDSQAIPVVPERDTSPLETGLIVPGREGDCPAAGHEQEEENKKRKPTAIEPPLPPAAQGAHDRTEQARIEPQAEALPRAKAIRDRDGFLIHPGQLSAIEPQPVVTQPQPQQPNAPRPLPAPPDPEAVVPVEPKARKRREPGFQPTAEDVPAALLPVVSELLAFWACKGGKRTERAWVAQLGQLRQIQDDPAGGTDAARSQLEAGSQAAVFGKAWMAVTHANWKRFGLKAGTPIAGTGFPGRRPSQTEAGAAAAAFIREREARRAAEAAQSADAITIPALSLVGVA